MKIDRILCPTDLSTGSDEALLYAAGLTSAYQAKLIACYCAGKKELEGAQSNADVTYAISRGQTKNLFEGALLRYLAPLEFAHLDWEGVVIEGSGDDIGAAIAEAAGNYAADMIVMRSRRRPHRAAILGSTAESVCRTAPCPVMVTHSDEREWIEKKAGGLISLKRILVAYDFSDYSELALKYALSLAQEYQAELHLLHVLPSHTVQQPEIAWYPGGEETPYHRAARRLQKSIPEETYLWCDVKHAVSEGQPYREILNYAEKNKIELISLGAHGAGFGMRALFGSNVDRVLRQAGCPVLVARPLKPTVATETKEHPVKASTQSETTR